MDSFVGCEEDHRSSSFFAGNLDFIERHVGAAIANHAKVARLLFARIEHPRNPLAEARCPLVDFDEVDPIFRKLEGHRQALVIPSVAAIVDLDLVDAIDVEQVDLRPGVLLSVGVRAVGAGRDAVGETIGGRVRAWIDAARADRLVQGDVRGGDERRQTPDQEHQHDGGDQANTEDALHLDLSQRAGLVQVAQPSDNCATGLRALRRLVGRKSIEGERVLGRNEIQESRELLAGTGTVSRFLQRLEPADDVGSFQGLVHLRVGTDREQARHVEDGGLTQKRERSGELHLGKLVGRSRPVLGGSEILAHLLDTRLALLLNAPTFRWPKQYPLKYPGDPCCSFREAFGCDSRLVRDPRTRMIEKGSVETQRSPAIDNTGELAAAAGVCSSAIAALLLSRTFAPGGAQKLAKPLSGYATDVTARWARGFLLGQFITYLLCIAAVAVAAFVWFVVWRFVVARTSPATGARLSAAAAAAVILWAALISPLLGLLVAGTLLVATWLDRKSTRLNSSHGSISYAV